MPLPAWQDIQPEEAGFVADLGDRLDWGLRSGLLRHLHVLLLLRAGNIVLERYYEGADESWGDRLGCVTFGPERLHDLRSVSKSVVGLLYGIALARGLVPPPEAPLLAQFPKYGDLGRDPDRAKLTLEHALTMTLGTDWDEGMSYRDPRNCEVAMERAPDRYRFVLERPIMAPPGTSWKYCGGATALLGGLIAKGCGASIADFAREALFEPLGIADFEWAAGRDGVPAAASGLRLTARDLARIGELVRAKGRWDGREVVPAAWIAASTQAAIATGDGLDYGRQWWLGKAAVPAFPDKPLAWFGGFGNGGQRLWIMPDAGLTLVVFSGNYNAMDSWITPLRIWREIVAANLINP